MRKGDTLVELSNPELEAGLVLAQAQLAQARALRNRVYAGPRQERVDALARDIDMANANLVYAQQQFTGLRNWLRPGSLRTRTSTRRLPPPRRGTRTSRVRRSDTRPPVSGRRVRNVRSPMPRLKLPSRQLL